MNSLWTENQFLFVRENIGKAENEVDWHLAGYMSERFGDTQLNNQRKRKVLKELELFYVREGVIYEKSTNRVVVSCETEATQRINEIHAEHCHCGYKKTFQLVSCFVHEKLESGLEYCIYL